MTLKGALRSAAAAQRRMEREARRRQRELERQQKQLSQLQEQEEAAFEVEEYEVYVEELGSIHKVCRDPWDWEAIHASGPPEEPTASHASQLSAQIRLDEYEPGLADKALRRVESTRLSLAAAVKEARRSDERAHAEALETHKRDYAIWGAKRQLAERILAGETDAHMEAVKRVKPFGDLAQFVSKFGFRPVNRHLGELFLLVQSEEIVPREAKSPLKSGKLSVKQMPKTRFYEIYQDYVCSCVLRAGPRVVCFAPYPDGARDGDGQHAQRPDRSPGRSTDTLRCHSTDDS